MGEGDGGGGGVEDERQKRIFFVVFLDDKFRFLQVILRKLFFLQCLRDNNSNPENASC